MEKDKVLKVINEDTFLTSGRKNPMRTAYIDTPET